MRLARALSSDSTVNSHVFFIAEEDTAEVMAGAMPPGRAHVVMDTTLMPLLFKNIFSEGEPFALLTPRTWPLPTLSISHIPRSPTSALPLATNAALAGGGSSSSSSSSSPSRSGKSAAASGAQQARL